MSLVITQDAVEYTKLNMLLIRCATCGEAASVPYPCHIHGVYSKLVTIESVDIPKKGRELRMQLARYQN